MNLPDRANEEDELTVTPVLKAQEAGQIEPAWAKFAGIFRDNPMFDEVMESIQADRDAWGDEPMDVSEYQR
jgi:hypothetical protein